MHTLKQFVACLTFAFSSLASAAAPSAASPRIVEALGRVPLGFEPNRGQIDPKVKFLSRGRGYGLFLTADEAVLAVSASEGARATTIRARLIGVAPAPQIEGEGELGGHVNYFRGNDRSKWRAGIPTFARVRYRSIYPGIDVVYYGNQRQLEFDFVLARGARPEKIRLAFAGANAVDLDGQGNVVLRLPGGELRVRRPEIYQEVHGLRRPITGGYVRTGKNEIGFRVGAHDRSLPVVIDPGIEYSTYIGNASYDVGSAIAVDAGGFVYLTGRTVDFPTTAFSFQPVYGGGPYDAFVIKFSGHGPTVAYSTYLGGTSWDEGNGIAVDAAGNAYIAGRTYSANFPVTAGAPQSTLAGVVDAFVAKLDPSGGSLVYSTYLGGSNADGANAIALDGSGCAHVTGYAMSKDFPTFNAIQPVLAGNMNSFVTKICSGDHATIAYSTFLGGSDHDDGRAIAVDAAGSAYVAGETRSFDFPGAALSDIQPALGGKDDGFVAKLDILGGTDKAYDIAVDAGGRAYVCGATTSMDFPTAFPVQPTNQGGADAFVTTLDALGGALGYSTYLGGEGDDGATGIALDGAGAAYVVGGTSSTKFPVYNALQPTFGGVTDAFVTKLTP